MTGKEVQNWADDFMFTAEKSDAVKGPEAFLLSATPDPLGSIAVAAEAYMGRFYTSKEEITDDQRRYYLSEMMKTKLKMPLEAVTFHWRIKGVTRAYTHQIVRQRTAAYSQESMRFAVKEDLGTAVALPPSLQWANEKVPAPEWHGSPTWTVAESLAAEHAAVIPWGEEFDRLPKHVRHLLVWRWVVTCADKGYNYLINDGMPAEDARGLTPHNIVTQLNYITNLRNYHDHAGNRLCTQAQFEWRIVWAKMLQAMRAHCSNPLHESPVAKEVGINQHQSMIDHSSPFCDNWQWVAISEIFLPVCYQTGKCQFEAEFDRKCSIRERVNANSDINRPATEWDQPFFETIRVRCQDPQCGDSTWDHECGEGVEKRQKIGAISPAEWLTDAAAAR